MHLNIYTVCSHRTLLALALIYISLLPRYVNLSILPNLIVLYCYLYMHYISNARGCIYALYTRAYNNNMQCRKTLTNNRRCYLSRAKLLHCNNIRKNNMLRSVKKYVKFFK